jgi:hypothetical protein
MVSADLWPDGMLRGEFVQYVDGDLRLIPMFCEEPVRIPTTLLRGLRFDTDRARWLSDLEPRAVEEVPYIGDADHFLYPHREDRTVTGRPLQVGGKRFAKGLGCHTRSRLSYDLGDGGYATFRAEVGISDEVLSLGHQGAAVFRIELDGSEVFRSAQIHGGEQAVRVGPIDVTGAAQIALIADFGSDEDVADRVVWGDAILLR